jgi:hypothetical protein
MRVIRDAWEEIAPGNEGPFTDAGTGVMLGSVARWVDQSGHPAEALDFLARIMRSASDAIK